MLKKILFTTLGVFFLLNYSYAGLEKYCLKIDSNTISSQIEDIQVNNNRTFEIKFKSCIDKRCCFVAAGPNTQFFVTENGLTNTGHYDRTREGYKKDLGYTTDYKINWSQKTMTSYYGFRYHLNEKFNNYIDHLFETSPLPVAIVNLILSLVLITAIPVIIIVFNIIGLKKVTKRR